MHSKSKGELLKVFCFIDKKVKLFYLHRMKRVEDHDWTTPQGITSFLQIYFRCVLTFFKSPSSVQEWLTSIGFDRYWGVFQENGFDC
jgi:hypothetical protein